jgi:hypothetical protein
MGDDLACVSFCRESTLVALVEQGGGQYPLLLTIRATEYYYVVERSPNHDGLRNGSNRFLFLGRWYRNVFGGKQECDCLYG